MTPSAPLNQKEIEALSAYLDGRLSEQEAARLQTNLAQHPEWRKQLQELGAVRSLLRDLPELHPPRNLTLPNEYALQSQRRNFSSLAFGFGSAFATAAAIFLFLFPLLSTGLSAHFAAQPVLLESSAAGAAPALASADQAAAGELASSTSTPEAALPQLKSFAPLPASLTPEESASSAPPASGCGDCSAPQTDGDGRNGMPSESPAPESATGTPTYSVFLPMAQKAEPGETTAAPPPLEITAWNAAAIFFLLLALALGFLFVRSRRR